jgi:uncharacterized membrane protein
MSPPRIGCWQPRIVDALGAFGITVALPVPRNERLARLSPASPEALADESIHVRKRLRWNHLRRVAALVSLAACAAAWAAHR